MGPVLFRRGDLDLNALERSEWVYTGGFNSGVYANRAHRVLWIRIRLPVRYL